MAKPLTNAVLSERLDVAPGLVILKVAPDGWQLPEFSAGQFAVMGLPGDAPRCEGAGPEPEPAAPDKLLKRAYSIASSPRAREALEFFIALVPTGSLTPRLFALQRGARVFIGPKMSGHFLMEHAPEDKQIVLVGTGTGLAPYISMLRTHLAARSRCQIAVLHGVRHSWDLAYRTELEALCKQHKNLRYLPVVSRPKDEKSPWNGPTGYVQDLWTRGAVAAAFGRQPTPGDTHVFLCGNPGMIDGMVTTLQKEDFVEQTREHPGQIHVERYW